MTEIRTADRQAPSKPYLTDDWTPTDPRLWEKVLMVAKGRRRQMTRVGPDGPRTIHAPHHGRGFRHWPNPKAVAWAVKQYNGYGGKWKGKGEEEGVTASEAYSPLHHHLITLKGEVDAQMHTIRDVLEGRVSVGVEGDSGKDMLLARRLGLFTCNVAGVDIFARCEEDARPLIHYLERGGTYGSLDFSRLLGYTADEVELYRSYLLLSAELPHPDQLNAFQKAALERARFGSVITTADESDENLWMIDLERRGLVHLADASIARAEGYWEITADGERFISTSLRELGKVPDQIQIGLMTCYNKAGLDAETLVKSAKRLERLLDGVQGWRARAFIGGVKVAFGLPKDFTTCTSTYRASEDTLYVRASHVLRRDAAFDYTLIQGLGHRFAKMFALPQDFEHSEWWTSQYSQKKGEGFPELFTIGHFGLTGAWDPAVVDRFEKVMS